MTSPESRLLRLTAGALIALAALYAAVAKIAWPAVWAAFSQSDPLWLGAAFGSVFATLAAVTVRWGLLLAWARPPNNGSSAWRDMVARPFRLLWDAVLIGQAVNIIFPLRFGEGARVAVTARELGHPVGVVVVAMAFERALDVSAFALLGLLLLFAGRMPGLFQGAVPTAALLAVATVVGALLMMRLTPAVLARLRLLVAGQSRLARWIAAQEDAIRGGGSGLLRGPRLTSSIILTALILLASAAGNWLVFRAFHLPVPALVSLVVLVVLQIGTVVVSVPGNVGVFHYLTVVTLGFWQVPPHLALAVAVVLHLVSLGTRVGLGVLAGAARYLRPSVVPLAGAERL